MSLDLNVLANVYTLNFNTDELDWKISEDSITSSIPDKSCSITYLRPQKIFSSHALTFAASRNNLRSARLEAQYSSLVAVICSFVKDEREPDSSEISDIRAHEIKSSG